jgi:hypothetical protein
MACPYLVYRDSTQDRTFEEPRAYCEVADRFVQPMRADICNDRYHLHHSSDCEIYQRAVEEHSTASTSEETDS